MFQSIDHRHPISKPYISNVFIIDIDHCNIENKSSTIIDIHKDISMSGLRREVYRFQEIHFKKIQELENRDFFEIGFEDPRSCLLINVASIAILSYIAGSQFLSNHSL